MSLQNMFEPFFVVYVQTRSFSKIKLRWDLLHYTNPPLGGELQALASSEHWIHYYCCCHCFNILKGVRLICGTSRGSIIGPLATSTQDPDSWRIKRAASLTLSRVVIELLHRSPTLVLFQRAACLKRELYGGKTKLNSAVHECV